jgi:hypothetical protein
VTPPQIAVKTPSTTSAKPSLKSPMLSPPAESFHANACPYFEKSILSLSPEPSDDAHFATRCAAAGPLQAAARDERGSDELPDAAATIAVTPA